VKKYIMNIVAVFAVAVLSLVSISSNTTAIKEAPVDREEKSVITVANSSSSDINYEKVLESRFLNMLNHNFVYGDDFKTIEAIVNNSVFALLDLRNAEDNQYIAETYVKDYVFNMYGIEIESFKEINSDFPLKDGFVYIIPTGYSSFEHKIKSVNKNEDGSYTVKTVMSEATHDSGTYIDECETLFVPNENSTFGFSIIRSVIGTTSISA